MRPMRPISLAVTSATTAQIQLLAVTSLGELQPEETADG
jgi:hypothetical protein